MPRPQDKIDAYLKQRRFRLRWLLLSLVVGVVVALVVHYTGSGFPTTHAGILAAGLLFFPVFVWQVNRKDHVSTLEAWRLRPRVKR